MGVRVRFYFQTCPPDYRGLTITPRKWVPLTRDGRGPAENFKMKPITPLFEHAIDLYNTYHSKILKTKSEKVSKIKEKLGNFLGKIDKKSILTRWKSAPTTAYNTHHLILARQ